MFDLTGMTALVTGASGGIGSEIARALAGQGARLALSGSNVAKLEAFAATLPGDHVCLPCDLSNAESVEALIPAAVAALGKLDILVNNAGITRDNLAMRMKDEEWDAVIRVNLEAAFRLCRAVGFGHDAVPARLSVTWPSRFFPGGICHSDSKRGPRAGACHGHDGQARACRG